MQLSKTFTAMTASVPSARFLTGLLGAPIAHSASPAMHERAAEAMGARCHYQLIEIAGADRNELRGILDGVRKLGFAGINVTFPYKEAVVELLDELSPGARAIGAVNTVVVRGGRLTGHNTDYGAVVDLVADLDRAMPFVVQGSGGMAKAVAAALGDSGFRDGTVVARNEATGRAIADRYGFAWTAEPEGEGALLVNATPCGMVGPDADVLAFPQAMIAACTVAFDVVQYPVATPFLKAAGEAGKRCITGAEVATLQALQQFVLYTGVTPSPAQVTDAADWARAHP